MKLKQDLPPHVKEVYSNKNFKLVEILMEQAFKGDLSLVGRAGSDRDFFFNVVQGCPQGGEILPTGFWRLIDSDYFDEVKKESKY